MLPGSERVQVGDRTRGVVSLDGEPAPAVGCSKINPSHFSEHPLICRDGRLVRDDQVPGIQVDSGLFVSAFAARLRVDSEFL